MLALLTFFPAYVLIPIDYAHAASVDCYCILYLRQVLGIEIHGDAWTIKGNIPQNQIKEGDVVLFDYGRVDHGALIVDVIQANYPERPGIYLTIQETNYKKCTPGIRTIPLSDPAIRGFYRPE